MAIVLPTTYALDRFAPRLVSATSELESAFGGATQRVARLGSRWAFDIALRPQRLECSFDWVGLLTEADTCVFQVPEPGLALGNLGTPRVKGGGQAGSTLVVDGLTPGVAVPMGKWLSVSVAGLLFGYRLSAAVVADEAGEADLPIRPMLRASPADNAVVNMATVTVEGFVTVDQGAFAQDRSGFVTSLGFTLRERR